MEDYATRCIQDTTGDLFAYSALSGFIFIKKTRQNWTYVLKGIFCRLGHYISTFLLWWWQSPYQFRANRRHLCYYLANIRRLRHSCAIGRSLCSYTHNCHDFCHQLLPTEINLFLIGFSKNFWSIFTEVGFTSNPNDFTSDSNNPFRHTDLDIMYSLFSIQSILNCTYREGRRLKMSLNR